MKQIQRKREESVVLRLSQHEPVHVDGGVSDNEMVDMEGDARTSLRRGTHLPAQTLLKEPRELRVPIGDVAVVVHQCRDDAAEGEQGLREGGRAESKVTDRKHG